MADTSTPKIDILDSTETAGEQLVSVVKQTQSVALDVARALAQALPPVPRARRRPSVSSPCPTWRPSRLTVSTWRANCWPRKRISRSRSPTLLLRRSLPESVFRAGHGEIPWAATTEDG